MSTSWKVSATTESQNIAASSPTWRNFAGAGGLELDRRSRSERAKKRKLFGDSSSTSSSDASNNEDFDSDEEEEDKEGLEELVPTSFARVLLEAHPLKALIERNSRCLKCGSEVTVKFSHVTIATSLSIACESNTCSRIDYIDGLQKASVVLPAGSNCIERNTDYAVNVLYTVGLLIVYIERKMLCVCVGGSFVAYLQPSHEQSVIKLPTDIQVSGSPYNQRS